ncbi:ABC transporter permease [Aporhodopirellula aestuarii]|uniref:ABC transporter permease n=1 Tax=Aporhodopirellula aestuarii TaxID=2950107 RepID=A0ABT0TWY9_9BACT|nr:ABC transporter permease [Aporhodopirellula aestuarii]MCM2369127.1 ABC transporter permease [Aporhodopirellula aestuarii]
MSDASPNSTDRQSGNSKSALTRFFGSRITWPVLGLAVVLLFNAIFIPSFFTLEVRDGQLYGSLIDVLNRGSIGVILAMGMTLVIATGGVDLSVGSVMAISGAIAALILTETQLGMLGIVPCVLFAALAAGLMNGVLVAYLKIQPIIATLILMVSGRGIAKFITGEKIITVGDDSYNFYFDFIGKGHLFGLPFTVTLFVTLFAVTSLFVRMTSLGLFIESVGANETASRASGIHDKGVKIAVYVFAAFCAVIAGLIDASNINAADTMNAGVFTELDAIFAVVVGGTALTGGRFSLTGSLIGAMLLQTLMTTLYTYGVPSDVAPVPKSLVIVAVCLLQSPVFRGQLQRLAGKGGGR